jgi:hypothetical protein
MRNSVCALSDSKFYLFFTSTVHFGGALIVLLPRHPLNKRSWGEFDAYPGVALCLKQAVNPAL